MYFLYPTGTGRERMKKTSTVILITIILLILFWGTIIPAAAEDAQDVPFIPVTQPETELPTAGTHGNAYRAAADNGTNQRCPRSHLQQRNPP